MPKLRKINKSNFFPQNDCFYDLRKQTKAFIFKRTLLNNSFGAVAVLYVGHQCLTHHEQKTLVPITVIPKLLRTQ